MWYLLLWATILYFLPTVHICTCQLLVTQLSSPGFTFLVRWRLGEAGRWRNHEGETPWDTGVVALCPWLHDPWLSSEIRRWTEEMMETPISGIGTNIDVFFQFLWSNTRKVDILATIKFNSTRKRSSVIARFKATGSTLWISLDGKWEKEFLENFQRSISQPAIPGLSFWVGNKKQKVRKDPFLISHARQGAQLFTNLTETNWGDRLGNTFQH